MPQKLYTSLLTVGLCGMFVGCAGVPSVAIAPAVPTAPPAPTAAPVVFAPGARIGGVAVAGLTAEQARTAVERALEPLAQQPLVLRAGEQSLTISAAEASLALPLNQLLAEAGRQQQAAQQVAVPLRVNYNHEAFRAALNDLAARVARPAELIVDSSEPLDHTFAVRPGKRLDTDEALRLIDERLRTPDAAGPLDLPLSADTMLPPRDIAQLQQQVEAMAGDWSGVVGFYLYDLHTKKETGFNQHSIFSGASIMKVPIMLQTFLSIPKLNREELGWLDRMIIDSDNLAANDLLARIAGGTGTEDALEGLTLVNQTLRDLGLPYTYQSMPYEGGDFLINTLGKDIYRGPPLDGPEPQTEADPYLRTTPLEMGRLMTMVVQCSKGTGLLLQRYPRLLSSQRCSELITRMKQNKDLSRIVAGLPKGTVVAHKSGWVEDMQADVAFVESPGGEYVMAIYLYRPINIEENYLADEVATPAIASFSRLVYSFYNPPVATTSAAQ